MGYLIINFSKCHPCTIIIRICKLDNITTWNINSEIDIEFHIEKMNFVKEGNIPGVTFTNESLSIREFLKKQNKFLSRIFFINVNPALFRIDL